MWIALLLQSERLFKLALTLTLPHETLKSKEKARPFYIVHLDKVKNSSWDIDFTCGHWSMVIGHSGRSILEIPLASPRIAFI